MRIVAALAGNSFSFFFLTKKMEGGGDKFSTLWPSGVMLSLSENVLMFVFLSVCLSVFPSQFLTPLNSLFVPTSQSPISKHFRYSESLGKSNGKKWSQIVKLLLIKVVNCHTFFYLFFFWQILPS